MELPQKTIKIGVAISTRNRRDIFNECYRNWKKMLPDGSALVVVDDASDVPCRQANTRFETQQGISKTKNECIRLLRLMGCTHLFLSDDDVWPKRGDWYEPYINSGEKHLSLSFQHNSAGDMYANDVFVRAKRDKYWVYNAPNGCLIYLHSDVVDAVGGYDEDFRIWGLEHRDFSMQVHRAGVTTRPFMDVPNGIDYFHSLDYLGLVNSSVPEHIRAENSARNSELFFKKHKDLIGTITIHAV